MNEQPEMSDERIEKVREVFLRAFKLLREANNGEPCKLEKYYPLKTREELNRFREKEEEEKKKSERKSDL